MVDDATMARDRSFVFIGLAATIDNDATPAIEAFASDQREKPLPLHVFASCLVAWLVSGNSDPIELLDEMTILTDGPSEQ
jgi:hypothetical protein